MTKTEKELLAILAEKGTIGIETHFGNGPEGGKIQHGIRRACAALKLVASGKASKTQSTISYDTRNGYTVRVVTFNLFFK